jgi:hypothetical protein
LIKKVKNIGLNSVGKRNANGIAYVFLPRDADREAYIANCFNTSTVSLVTENGEYFHKVPIGKLAIQMIDFPLSVNQTGSPVLWSNVPIHNQIIVTDVFEFKNQFQSLEESQFKITKRLNNNVAGISLRGKAGQILMSASGESEGSGQMEINLSNFFQTALFKMFVQGEILLKSTASFFVNSFNAFKLSVLNGNNEAVSRIEATLNNITIDSETIQHSDGKEPMVLGDTLEALLEDFITAVSNITVTTSLGVSPIINKAQVEALKQRVEAIKSKISKLS